MLATRFKFSSTVLSRSPRPAVARQSVRVSLTPKQTQCFVELFFGTYYSTMVRKLDGTRDPLTFKTILVWRGQLVSISRRCGSIIMLCRTRHPNLGTAVMKNWPREADFRFTGFLFFPRGLHTATEAAQLESYCTNFLSRGHHDGPDTPCRVVCL